MWQAHCLSCEQALNQVMISLRWQRHIIRRHYSRPAYGRSLFFPEVMPSNTLFITVTNELRSGLEVSEIQEISREGRSIVRQVYFYSFAFAIGVCLSRLGSFRRTKTIKIVCNTIECQKCHRRWPSELVTIYPC